ncbi:YdcH family protein [Pseudahrensia aquimaris]|uniref:YdcH family protein n=1 Tax=Pseudahrensia aquimaris TaxID=744461 RepID=A0ABW3FA62_9HYPH
MAILRRVAISRSRLKWKENIMSNVPHELAEEFPEHVAKMSELKQSDAHFAKLFDAYHEVNRHVHRIETRVEPASDTVETELRKKRMILKDEISAMLSA